MSTWRTVSGVEAARLEEELAREVSSGHALWGRACRAVARRDDRDDVAYEAIPGGLCVVHLTYAAESDPHWPEFVFVEIVVCHSFLAVVRAAGR